MAKRVVKIGCWTCPPDMYLLKSIYFTSTTDYIFSVLATTTLYNPLQPPKLSMMLSLGVFQPPASVTPHDLQQPPKSSMILSFGGFWPSQAPTSLHDPQQPPLASMTLDNPQNHSVVMTQVRPGQIPTPRQLTWYWLTRSWCHVVQQTWTK